MEGKLKCYNGSYLFYCILPEAKQFFIESKKRRPLIFSDLILISEPAGTRTQGPNIKSVVLYQLSYEFNLQLNNFLIFRAVISFLGVQKYAEITSYQIYFVFYFHTLWIEFACFFEIPSKPLPAWARSCTDFHYVSGKNIQPNESQKFKPAIRRLTTKPGVI